MTSKSAGWRARLERWSAAVESAWSALEAWVEANPRRAWIAAGALVLLVVGIEVAWWPLHDYPGSMWHATPRGADVEVAQANAAKVGWKEWWGFWTGRILHGNAYWQPLTSWLFVIQYRLFGTNDRLWQIPSLLLHLGVCVQLVWAAGRLERGPLLRRLSVGVLAAFFLGAPGFADRDMEKWTLGWWPAQTEMISLLLGLPLILAAVRYAETGERRWALLAPLYFFLALSFKENGYMAGLGACLVLVRRPRAWPLLGVLAVQGVAMFLYRWWAIGELAFGTASDARRLVRLLHVLPSLDFSLGVHLVGLAVGGLAALALRRRWSLPARLGLVLGIDLIVAAALIGPPWDPMARAGLETVLGWATAGVLLYGIARTLRRWPVPELWGIWGLTVLSAGCFAPIWAWHRYWHTALGGLLGALAVAALVEAAWPRLRAAAVSPPQELPSSAGGIAL